MEPCSTLGTAGICNTVNPISIWIPPSFLYLALIAWMLLLQYHEMMTRAQMYLINCSSNEKVKSSDTLEALTNRRIMPWAIKTRQLVLLGWPSLWLSFSLGTGPGLSLDMYYCKSNSWCRLLAPRVLQSVSVTKAHSSRWAEVQHGVGHSTAMSLDVTNANWNGKQGPFIAV